MISLNDFKDYDKPKRTNDLIPGWECSSCGLVNLMKSIKCSKCSKARRLMS